jgi:cysteine dioxygenase
MNEITKMSSEKLGTLIGESLRFRVGKDERTLDLEDLNALVNVEAIIEKAKDLHQPDKRKPYGRAVVFAQRDLEAMVATWTPGLPCAPHDHGGSFGAVRILQGRAQHTLWRIQDGQLVKVHEHFAEAGETLCCEPSLVHSIGDAGPADGSGETLRTLHMYTESIDHMMVYDVPNKRTLVVDGGCGAWTPYDQPEFIRDQAEGFIGREAAGIGFNSDIRQGML